MSNRITKKKKQAKIFLPNFGYVISNLSKFDNFTDHEYKQCLQKVKKVSFGVPLHVFDFVAPNAVTHFHARGSNM